MEFEVRQAKIKNVGSNLADIKSTLSKLSGNISDVANGLNRSDRAMTTIWQNLNGLASGLEKTENRVDSLSSGIIQISTQYANSEKDICGIKESISLEKVSTDAINAVKEETEEKNPWEWTAKNWWDVIGNFGVIGGTISTFGNIFTGGNSAKGWTNVSKALLKLIGNGASLVKTKSSGGKWTDYLWGGNSALSGVTVGKWGDTFLSSMKKQFTTDLTLKTGATTADKVKVATKWGGYALTLASNVIDNYDEYKDSNGKMSEGRAVAETVIETGVDIALGAAATAAVTATAAALGFTAAPAVVVGTAAVGVTWAANALCKKITGGKDIAERFQMLFVTWAKKQFRLARAWQIL